MALLTYSDLTRYAAGLSFTADSQPSIDDATEVIADWEAHVTNALVAKGYAASTVTDTAGDLYRLARNYTGNRAAAQLNMARTRGAQPDLAKRCDERADDIWQTILATPDIAAGAAATASHASPNRFRSGGQADNAQTTAQLAARSFSRVLTDAGKL